MRSENSAAADFFRTEMASAGVKQNGEAMK